MQFIYAKFVQAFAGKMLDDVAKKVWLEAYTAGFEDGSDCVIEQWDDFSSGYEQGYKAAKKSLPNKDKKE